MEKNNQNKPKILNESIIKKDNEKMNFEKNLSKKS